MNSSILLAKAKIVNKKRWVRLAAAASSTALLSLYFLKYGCDANHGMLGPTYNLFIFLLLVYTVVVAHCKKKK